MKSVSKNNILFAVLTSDKPEKLKRCLQSVNSNSSPHERIVVINTTDNDFASLASSISTEYEFPFHISESNGTPGLGKNSVLDYFQESDHDYLVLIDGDDYLTLDARDEIDQFIETHEFDVLALGETNVLIPDGEISTREWLRSRHFLRQIFKSVSRKELSEVMSLFNELKHYTTGGVPMNRPFIFTKKGATVKFDEELLAAEDSLHNATCLNTDDIDYVVVEDSPIYVYDNTELGRFHLALKDGVNNLADKIYGKLDAIKNR